MSVVGNWQREAARFAPALRVYAHHGAERGYVATRWSSSWRDIDLIVTTYATATRDIDELAAHQWNRVVLDEAQAVKNSLSRGAKAVRRLEAEHRVALTGTPVENRLAELWSIMDLLNPGVLGSSEVFRARYAVPVEKYGQTEPAERLRASPAPTFCDGSRQTRRSSMICPRRSRSSSTAGSPPNRHRYTSPSSTR